jgi:hypothetical protein
MVLRILKLLFTVAMFAVPAAAAEMPQPSGAVVLTVTGQIGVSNRAGEAQFDMAMLHHLAEHSFETTTIWTEGPQRFTGVQLSELVRTLNVSEGSIRATAINDYSIDIPLEDAVDGGALVAYARNGAPMSVRENGPLWIVYPYDINPAYQSEIVYSRSIWQLDRLEFVTP